MSDIEVQYFSHLNGLVLNHDWQSLFNVLDATLVNGLLLPQITSCSVDNDTGNIIFDFVSDHKSQLFQIVELSGFVPEILNGKYRIKGVPNNTQLILKSDLNNIGNITIGTAKLASLGYEIVWQRDTVRVYRAKNPTPEHPFIRVDITLSSATGSYDANYARYAMVGLIENMTHIDDYKDPEKVQLPFDPNDPEKNWRITGTGGDCVRGWARWYWATLDDGKGETSGYYVSEYLDLCVIGDNNAFYLCKSSKLFKNQISYGCGLFDSSISDVNNYFLMSAIYYDKAKIQHYIAPAALINSYNDSLFFVKNINNMNAIYAYPIMPDYKSGYSNVFRGSYMSALNIPFYDKNKCLRGNLKHILYSGNKFTHNENIKQIIVNNSMYLFCLYNCYLDNIGFSDCGFYFYLGEL